MNQDNIDWEAEYRFLMENDEAESVRPVYSDEEIAIDAEAAERFRTRHAPAWRRHRVMEETKRQADFDPQEDVPESAGAMGVDFLIREVAAERGVREEDLDGFVTIQNGVMEWVDNEDQWSGPIRRKGTMGTKKRSRKF